MDPYLIDGHKLIYHPRRVARWLEGENIYPLYLEISPTGACNHRCTFCGLDFLSYRPRLLDAEVLVQGLHEMGRLGIKSIMFAGEGEPFLYPQMIDVVRETAAAGIHSAFTTNGSLLIPEISRQILGISSWIRVSCNAGTASTYANIHRTQEDDFHSVWTNLQEAVRIKAENGYTSTIGVQTLLLPENCTEMADLAQRCRDRGIDYLTIKPFSQHPLSRNRQYQDVSYDDLYPMAETLKAYETADFKVIFRQKSMLRWDAKKRTYQRCLALPFWAYIDAGGNVWGCSMHMNDDRFRLGNISEHTFEEIWQGEKRRRLIEWVENELDPTECRVNCRMNAINEYLWELKHPGLHVNFI